MDPVEKAKRLEEQIEALIEDFLLLHGCFEFLRTSDKNALPNWLESKWTRHFHEGQGGFAGRNWNEVCVCVCVVHVRLTLCKQSPRINLRPGVHCIH